MIIYSRQEAAFGIGGGESESLEESGPHLGISQFFPSDSQNANQPEQLPEGLGQNLDVACPYGQPAARGGTPANDYLLQNPLGTVMDELPSPTPPSPLSFPLTPYPTWNPEEPSAASGLVAPQEIQFPEVVGQPRGESSYELKYQSFEQMGMNPQQEESTPSAELQLGTSNDPPPPQSSVANSFYDPKYEEMGLPVDPHLRMFLAKHDQVCLGFVKRIRNRGGLVELENEAALADAELNYGNRVSNRRGYNSEAIRCQAQLIAQIGVVRWGFGVAF
ncbi:hypothetical protein L6164_016544 [Bauhinia variegata]|uniref:Uncharacterized protein n=1 Tax=Bauhinia variegata TaxID=167791 RepID=A0ACB9NNY9_BAUVA|nr:hypothetical protein L6164_016544 [Bauhinia variegata]